MAEDPMVLLIEDHEEVRAWMAGMLRLAGHIVATAANGAEALSLLRLVRPSVIISDLDMPVMHGWTFREQQLTSPELRDIPFVVCRRRPCAPMTPRRCAPERCWQSRSVSQDS